MIDLYKKVLVGQLEGTREGEVPESSGLANQEVDTEIWKASMTMNPRVSDYGTKEAEIIDFGVLDSGGKLTNVIEKETYFEIFTFIIYKSDYLKFI